MDQVDRLKDFVVRPPTEDDAPRLADLISAYDLWAFGTTDFTIGDLRDEWSHPGFTRETDATLVATQAGEIVGYAAVRDHGQHARLFGDGYVHPQYHGRGIGTALVRWSESRARDLMALAAADAEVTLGEGTAGTDVAAANLFAREGFSRVRTFWDMAVRLDQAPAAPAWPEGIAVRPFVPGEDEFAAYTAADEAFQDHWDYAPIPFEEWRASRIEREGFDPALVFLAWEGDTVVGAIRCRSRGEGGSESGWVDNLSVRRPWRGRGLGAALLLHAFAAFHRRGMREAALGVDAESLTGATRLYERAGMQVERRFDIYRKTLREGREPA